MIELTAKLPYCAVIGHFTNTGGLLAYIHEIDSEAVTLIDRRGKIHTREIFYGADPEMDYDDEPSDPYFIFEGSRWFTHSIVRQLGEVGTEFEFCVESEEEDEFQD